MYYNRDQPRQNTITALIEFSWAEMICCELDWRVGGHIFKGVKLWKFAWEGCRFNPIVRSGPALSLCLNPISCFSRHRNMSVRKLSSRPKVIFWRCWQKGKWLVVYLREEIIRARLGTHCVYLQHHNNLGNTLIHLVYTFYDTTHCIRRIGTERNMIWEEAKE